MSRKKRVKKSGRSKGSGTLFKVVLGFLLKVVPILIFVFAAGGAAVGVSGLLFADPHLSIQQITVVPVDALSREQRLRLEAHLSGKNILRADITRISEMLEKDPWIKKAVVSRKIPSEISIEVEKRLTAAYVRFAGNGGMVLVSEDGMVLEIASAHPASGLVIEVPGGKSPGLGERLSVKGFEAAAQFLKEFPRHPLAQFEAVTKVSLDAIGNVSTVLGKGPELRLGRKPLEAMKSFDKIAPILESSERQKIDYIDLQFNNVIVKQKNK